MGVYVHIPFCRSKCYYCGFYSVASIVFKQAFIRALCREIELRKDYLGTYKPETLYLGGGLLLILLLMNFRLFYKNWKKSIRFLFRRKDDRDESGGSGPG